MKQITHHKKLIKQFLRLKHNPDLNDWNVIMEVIKKIEAIIEHGVDMHNSIEIVWWYSKKKTGTFEKGAGGGGGGTIKRTPFESIFGKCHTISCYYYPKNEIKFKVKKNELADSKKEAVINVCSRWIEWYNRTVLKKK